MIEKLFKLTILLSFFSCAGVVKKEAPNKVAMRVDQANSPFQVLGVSPSFKVVELEQKKVWLTEKLGDEYPVLKKKVEESYKLLLNIKRVSSFKLRKGDHQWPFEDDKAFYGLEWRKHQALVHVRREIEKVSYSYRVVVRPKAVHSKDQPQLDYVQKQIAELRLQHRKPSYEIELRELEEKFYELAHQSPQGDSFGFHPRFVFEQSRFKSRTPGSAHPMADHGDHLLSVELGLK